MKLLGADILIAQEVATDLVRSSGIIVRGDSQKSTLTGRVAAVGPGLIARDGSRVPLPVAVGQRVVFNQYTKREVVNDEGTYALIDLDDLLMAIDDAAVVVRMKGSQL